MISVVLLCAGTGSRVGLSYNKLLYRINNKEVFLYTLEKFLDFSDIVIVASSTDFSYISSLVSCYKNVSVVIGGNTRLESSYNGVINTKNDIVLIHDAARVLVSKDDIFSLVNLYNNNYNGLCLLSSKLVHSLFDSNFNYLKRDNYYNALTPQVVLKDLFIKSYNSLDDKLDITDDISLIRRFFDVPVKAIEGSSSFKLTTKEDLLFLEKYLSNSDFLIGHSLDVHRFIKSTPLYLGGILIDYPYGLLAHSDGDVVLHSLAEAIIGALGLGDLGDHFPPSDKSLKGISSSIILNYSKDLLIKYNYSIVNVDILIFSEDLKISRYKDGMKKCISSILEISSSKVNIKATTTEKLGFIGENKGLACESVVLIKRM